MVLPGARRMDKVTSLGPLRPEFGKATGELEQRASSTIPGKEDLPYPAPTPAHLTSELAVGATTSYTGRNNMTGHLPIALCTVTPFLSPS